MLGIGQARSGQGRQAARGQVAEIGRGIHHASWRDHRGIGGDGRGLINAHVVHQHVLGRKRRVGVGMAQKRGIAADGQVQQDEERVVEDPVRSSGQRSGRDGMEQGTVHEPLNGILRPLDGIHVIVVRHLFAEGQSIGLADAACAGIPRTVRRAVVYRGIVGVGPEVLHDVDFAAARPGHRRDVLAEHPEGRPHALSERQLDARDNPCRYCQLPSVVWVEAPGLPVCRRADV